MHFCFVLFFSFPPLSLTLFLILLFSFDVYVHVCIHSTYIYIGMKSLSLERTSNSKGGGGGKKAVRMYQRFLSTGIGSAATNGTHHHGNGSNGQDVDKAKLLSSQPEEEHDLNERLAGHAGTATDRPLNNNSKHRGLRRTNSTGALVYHFPIPP